MKIALDAMGGDLAPKAVIEGAVIAARDLGVEIILTGDRDTLAKELAEHDVRGLKIEIEHAAEVVAMDDAPLDSVLNKPDSSIHVGLEMVKQGRADGFVSAGNSGAMMAAAMAILGTLPGVDRPAIASLVPTSAGFALLIDAGANTDVKAVHLMQFGVMGSVYWHHVFNVARPRVGILSNGEESSKGTELTRAAAAALTAMAAHINYVGYVEGRDINRARAEVVVTDGFTGNVTLKTMEGFAAFMLGNLREVFSSGMLRRVAYLMVRRKLNALRERLDPAEYGGAPLLGVNGVAVIAHGSSNARAIRNAVRAAANESLVRHVNSEIVEILSHSPAEMVVKPSSKGIRGLFGRMRDRLHLHRDGHPERKPDKAVKGDRPEKIDKAGRAEHGEGIEAAGPPAPSAAAVTDHAEPRSVIGVANGHQGADATASHNGAADAHRVEERRADGPAHGHGAHPEPPHETIEDAAAEPAPPGGNPFKGGSA
ncbi:MAG: phosphate acyltransferase PlsX [Candidatus Binataceae bacterium]|nr:phosphate acyltransferase PlsX [Candidatus Binataceae bacterium]